MRCTTARHRTRTAALVVTAVCLAAAAVAAAPAKAAVVPDDFRPYQDVPEGHTHGPAINGLSVKHLFDTPHLFEGTLCESGFCPEEPLLRADFAVWAARVLLYLDGNPMGDETSVKWQDPDPLPPVQVSQFTDVPASASWAPHAHFLLERGATRGCATGDDGVLRFCGDETVTRGQMASFLARIFDLPDADPAGFADVSAGHAHKSNIDRLASWGITRGCDIRPLRFCADLPVTRGQMASFVSRAVGGVGDPPEGYDRFVDISVGRSAVCGVRVSGKLECWDFFDPEFWDQEGPTDPSAHPATGITDVPPGEFLDVEVADQHACARRTNWTLVCWGFTIGRLGNFKGGGYSQFSLNDSTGCGISDVSGEARCWGINSWNTQEPRDFYDDIPGAPFAQVSAGSVNVCGLRHSGTIRCWGQDTWSEDGKTHILTQPPNGKYTYVAAGGAQNCAIRTDGEVVCWGNLLDADWLADILEGAMSIQDAEMWGALPAAPPPGPFATIDWSGLYKEAVLCGLRVDGTGICWGNILRSVGIQPPPGSRQFTALETGGANACGIRPRGHIECWGVDVSALTGARWIIL